MSPFCKLQSFVRRSISSDSTGEGSAVATILSETKFRAVRDALAACIALAIAPVWTRAGAAPPARGTTWTVENCDDDGPGSLRQILSMVADGDAVDLRALACGTITLTTGALEFAVDDLVIEGTEGHLTIDAAGSSRVLFHRGTGTLRLFGLGFANGFAAGASGGCIYSAGSVDLDDAVVRGCLAEAPQSIGGGGVFARADIDAYFSTIADNTAILSNARYYDGARGAGLFAGGDLAITCSTISGNSVLSNSAYSGGGGFWSTGRTTITRSTIEGNHAFFGGAGEIESFGAYLPSEIVDSTISGNNADFRTAGIVSFASILRIENSTIAFNSTPTGFVGGGTGVLTLGSGNFLYLGSSIIAGNTVGGLADDLCWQGDRGGGVIGRDNLIIASCNGYEPPDTNHADPLLAPLADNGGPTMTHALLPGSPALDRGNNASFLPTDQRGADRVSGPRADIGAFEQHQSAPPDAIFRDGFDPPG
jgi:hypothetical protein